MLQQIHIQIDGQHEVGISQSDIAMENFQTLDELASCDREVRMITTGKPQWEEQEAQFHIFYPEHQDTGQTVRVCQTTTTSTLWQDAKHVLNSTHERAKLKSIFVVLDALGNMEELTRSDAGPKQLGDRQSNTARLYYKPKEAPKNNGKSKP